MAAEKGEVSGSRFESDEDGQRKQGRHRPLGGWVVGAEGARGVVA